MYVLFFLQGRMINFMEFYLVIILFMVFLREYFLLVVLLMFLNLFKNGFRFMFMKEKIVELFEGCRGQLTMVDMVFQCLGRRLGLQNIWMRGMYCLNFFIIDCIFLVIVSVFGELWKIFFSLYSFFQ